jgi:hypothetical protein
MHGTVIGILMHGRPNVVDRTSMSTRKHSLGHSLRIDLFSHECAQGSASGRGWGVITHTLTIRCFCHMGGE